MFPPWHCPEIPLSITRYIYWKKNSLTARYIRLVVMAALRKKKITPLPKFSSASLSPSTTPLQKPPSSSWAAPRSSPPSSSPSQVAWSSCSPRWEAFPQTLLCQRSPQLQARPPIHPVTQLSSLQADDLLLNVLTHQGDVFFIQGWWPGRNLFILTMRVRQRVRRRGFGSRCTLGEIVFFFVLRWDRIFLYFRWDRIFLYFRWDCIFFCTSGEIVFFFVL